MPPAEVPATTSTAKRVCVVPDVSTRDQASSGSPSPARSAALRISAAYALRRSALPVSQDRRR